MKIHLDSEDYSNIATIIADSCNGEHTILYSDLDIEVRYRREVKGYDNNDYYGADEFAITHVDIDVQDISCDNIDVECDTKTIERLVEEIIKI